MAYPFAQRIIDAPQRLQREVDAVFGLQSEVQTVERTISNLRTSLSKLSQDSKETLVSLRRTHERLTDKIEMLYASLNIHEQFPELQNHPLEFVKLLLMARDLKINIKQRAIGSFLEWDKLDQAVGGVGPALGRPAANYSMGYLIVYAT